MTGTTTGERAETGTQTGAVAESSAERPTEDAAPEGAPASGRPRRGRPRKGAAKGVELVLTVTAGAEASDWRAELVHAGQKVVTELAVPASSVSAAAKDLHPDIAEAIESVLGAARERQRSRVEQLQAELESARQALAHLEE